MTSRDRIEHGLVPALQVKGRPIETFSIDDRLRRYSVPGAAVAVVRDGEVERAERNGTPLKTSRTLGTWSVPGDRQGRLRGAV